MEKSQGYIGTPNGVIVCLDEIDGQRIKGEFYHCYSEKGTEFSDLNQTIFQLEQFYDSMKYPYPTVNSRTFRAQSQSGYSGEKRSKIVKDEELLQRHGDIGTFIIRVQHRQNSSWQGRITWLDKNQTLAFRSVWELMKLIASALDMVSAPEDEEMKISWED